MAAPLPTQPLLTEPEAAATIAAILAGGVASDDPVLDIAGALLAATPEAEIRAATPEVAAAAAAALATLAATDAPVEKPSEESLEGLDFARGQGVLAKALAASRRLAGGTLGAREALLRGWYALNAYKRVRKGQGPLGKMRALRRETTYFKQHLEASGRRVAAQGLLQAAAELHGPIMGWHAVLAENTTRDCRAAHGWNFDIRKGPPRLITGERAWPGVVHPFCRCTPGAPFPGARLMAA